MAPPAGPPRREPGRRWRLVVALALAAGPAVGGSAPAQVAPLAPPVEMPAPGRPLVPATPAIQFRPATPAVPEVPAVPAISGPVVESAPPVLPAPLPAEPPPPPPDALFPPPVDFEVDARPGNPNPAVASATPTVPVFGGYKPLPGSLEDTLLREYAARDLYRAVTWRETVWTLFPTSLLWEPPMANRREPRMSAEVTSLDTYRNDWTLTTSLGTTVSLFRAEPIGSAVKYQLDLFGVVHTRLSPDDLLLADYRFGFPVSFERGPWSGKIGYEHTSAHLGDEGIAYGGYRMTRYAKDELVVGLSRWFENCLRLYAQAGYAFYQDLPKEYDRWRYGFGFEAYKREPTGWHGTPYAAADVEFRGEQDYTANLNVQIGWLWRNPGLRLSDFRIFASYYTGGSPYGQFFEAKESYGGFGLAIDY